MLLVKGGNYFPIAGGPIYLTLTSRRDSQTFARNLARAIFPMSDIV